MKRVVFGAFVALALTSCGGETDTTDETVENPINTENVVELEKATFEVEEGLKDLENSMNELESDIDSLLNGI